MPGKIVDIYEQNGLKMGLIDFGGVRRETCLAYFPDAQVGEYVLVHVGFALERIDEQEALKTLALFQEISGVESGPGSDSGAAA